MQMPRNQIHPWVFTKMVEENARHISNLFYEHSSQSVYEYCYLIFMRADVEIVRQAADARTSKSEWTHCLTD